MKKTRKVFKKKSRKIKNKILQDSTGDELEFPDLDDNSDPSVGDKILIDNKANLTGERLMPNGETIVFVNGIVTEIIEAEEEVLNLIKLKKDNLNRKIEITGHDKSKPYLKGNGILVDGKELIMGKVLVGSIQLNVFRGKISKVVKA